MNLALTRHIQLEILDIWPFWGWQRVPSRGGQPWLMLLDRHHCRYEAWLPYSCHPLGACLRSPGCTVQGLRPRGSEFSPAPPHGGTRRSPFLEIVVALQV